MILKSLNSYNASFKTSFASSIDTIEILYYKGLYKQCFKLITKLKKQIYKLEKFHLLFEVLIWERSLLSQMEDYKNYFELRTQIKDEEEALLKRMESIHKYSYAHFYSYYSYLKDDTAFRYIKEEDFKKNAAFLITPVDETQLCFQEKFSKSAGESYYYHFIKDFEKAAGSSKRMLQLLEDNPVQIELSPFSYLAASLTYMLMLLQLGYYDEILLHCKKVRNLQTQLKQVKSSKLLQNAIFNTAPSYELAVYVTIADVKKAVALIPEIEDGIDKFKSLMNEQHYSVWCFNVALTYFLNEDYKSALKWLNYIINETVDRIRTDFTLSVTIFRLIIHYELQNESFYPYLLRSSYRRISKLHFNPRILSTLVSGLKILFNATDKKKIELALKQIRQDLTPLLSYSDFRGWLNYFDITQWMDSKINRVSFAEIMHKEAMKRKAKPVK